MAVSGALLPSVDRVGDGTLRLPGGVAARLIDVCVGALPHKAYGLVGGVDALHPSSVYPCVSNLRNTPEWTAGFLAFGDFYRDADRGFVISADECARVYREMNRRGEQLAAVFHSHRCREAYPSDLDVAMHVSDSVLAYIVSVLRPDAPVLRIYRIEGGRVEEVPYVKV